MLSWILSSNAFNLMTTTRITTSKRRIRKIRIQKSKKKRRKINIGRMLRRKEEVSHLFSKKINRNLLESPVVKRIKGVIMPKKKMKIFLAGPK